MPLFIRTKIEKYQNAVFYRFRCVAFFSVQFQFIFSGLLCDVICLPIFFKNFSRLQKAPQLSTVNQTKNEITIIYCSNIHCQHQYKFLFLVQPNSVKGIITELMVVLTYFVITVAFCNKLLSHFVITSVAFCNKVT